MSLKLFEFVEQILIEIFFMYLTQIEKIGSMRKD